MGQVIMSNDRIIEEYRRHKLLSALYEGKNVGRVWKGKELLSEIEGESIDDVLQKLRDFVDASFFAAIKERTGTLDSSEYIKAFQSLLDDLSDGHLAMLKAHYLAPNQEITATLLASAAGYSSYGAANLQYGLIAKKLYEELPIDLPKRKDGTFIYTFSLATAGDINDGEEHWVWKLRPEVSSAIEYLGLAV